MAAERKAGLLDRQRRLSRGSAHYEVLQNGMKLKEHLRNDLLPSVIIQTYVIPKRNINKVEKSKLALRESSSIGMSVEESLQYFDETVSALDRTHEKQVYESESDLISEFGYASGYTELSATSDSEDRQLKQTGAGNRRRKSRQNRNQRFQSDPILGDLESDSTNDGQLFGSENTQRVRTRTNSGQRRQRERRRQRRQNANRNSWTDSGLSLSKTDSQRSSHGEMSPLKRGRSKTVVEIHQAGIIDGREKENVEKKASVPDKSSTQPDSGISSPGLSAGSPAHDKDIYDKKAIDDDIASAKINNNEAVHSEHRPTANADLKARDTNLELSSHKIEDPPVASSSLVNSLDSSSKSLNEFFMDIKPTNWRGVVNGTYTPKEKEILHQVFQNAQNSSKGVDNCNQSPRGSQSSKFPLPPHLDYPFCMYRQDDKKAKKSNGIMKGLRKLKQGIASKRNSAHTGSEGAAKHMHQPSRDAVVMPPSKPVDKKKSLLKRIFRQNDDTKSKGSSAFRRDRFGSTRSFSGSVSHLFSRGNRARSQSVENLKNCLRRGRDSIMKRSNSVISLNGKMTRSLSVSSLVSRRNAFTRQGSMVSIPGQFSRSSNGQSNFRRSESVRSLHGGYDIATRVLQPREIPQNYYEDRNENCQQMPPHQSEMSVPFRGGWRPASRISRRETCSYDAASYYDESDYLNYNEFYGNEDPCPCCYDEVYYDNGAHYNDYYEHSMDQYYDQRDMYHSHVTIANADSRPIRQHIPRAPSTQSMYNPCMRPQSQVSSYYSPANVRRDNRMVIAPLSVQVTHERKAERRQLSTSMQVCDTMV